MAPARRKGSTPSKAATPTAKEAGDGRGEGSSGGGGSTSSKPPPLSLLLVGVGSVAVGIGGVVASRAMYARSTAASVEPAGSDPGGQRGQSRAAENLMRRLRDESGGASQASYRPADFDPVRAAREFGLVELMDSITREYPGARYVSKDPPIILIDDFVTDEECEHIIKIGTPGLEVSTGTGAYKNGKFTRMKMESRTSYNSWLMNGLERDSVVKRVDRRIANVTGLYDGNSEHYQVLRYLPPDQFYKLRRSGRGQHSDFIDSQVLQPCGPRLFTFFLYLKDVQEGMGGETFFPFATPLNQTVPRGPCSHPQYTVTLASEVDCGMLVSSRKRSAVIWPNVDPADFSRQHPKTNHAALAIREECKPLDGKMEGCLKWAANVWIHLFDFKGAHGRGQTG